MITNTEFWTLGTGFTVLLLAYVLLRSPRREVQYARLFASICAGLSAIFTMVAVPVRLLEEGKLPQVDTSPALALLATALPVVLLLLLTGGALWLMRGRLRPRGFQKRVTVVGRKAWQPANEARWKRYRRVQP